MIFGLSCALAFRQPHARSALAARDIPFAFRFKFFVVFIFLVIRFVNFRHSRAAPKTSSYSICFPLNSSGTQPCSLFSYLFSKLWENDGLLFRNSIGADAFSTTGPSRPEESGFACLFQWVLVVKVRRPPGGVWFFVTDSGHFPLTNPLFSSSCSSPIRRFGHRLTTRTSSWFSPALSHLVTSTSNGFFQRMPAGFPLTGGKRRKRK